MQDVVDLILVVSLIFWQKQQNVDGKNNKLKSGDSLKIEKKYKDLESASASRRSRGRKRSSSYTSDPCTPPKDAQMSSAPVGGTTATSNAKDDATELHHMLIAGEDNYLKSQQETTPDNVGRKCYCC